MAQPDDFLGLVIAVHGNALSPFFVLWQDIVHVHIVGAIVIGKKLVESLSPMP